MAIYCRATVAHELAAAKWCLATLQCDKETSHAINIVFSHIKHQEYDITDLMRGVSELYSRIEK